MDGEFSSVRPDGASERLVGNTASLRLPECFISGQTRWDGILLVTFLLLLKEK